MGVTDEELGALLDSAVTEYEIYSRKYFESVSKKGITSESMVLLNVANIAIAKTIVILLKLVGAKELSKILAEFRFGDDWPLPFSDS